MSRAASGDVIEIAPTNNIYTVLAAAATLVVAIGLIVVFLRAHDLGVTLFGK